MRIDPSGNVGIGTTAPTGPLEVYKSNSGGLGGHIILNNNGTAIGNETAVLFNDSGVGGNNSVRAAISSSVEGAPYFGDLKFKTGASSYASLNTRMIITGAGNVGIGTTSPGEKLEVHGTIFINGDGDFLFDGTSGGDGFQMDYYSGQMYFGNKLGTSWHMVMKDNGNVGIGTTSPVAQLQVTSATNAVDVLRIGNTAGDSGSVQGVTHLAINHFNAGTNPSTRITAYQDGVSGWPGGMYFSTRSLNTDSAPVERMRITSGGNVGIGTTAPSHLLHVAGDVRIDAADNAPQVNYFDSSLNYVYGESGAQEIILGKPDIWLRINVDGVDYVFPGYNVTA
jgi:hypothetical protein